MKVEVFSAPGCSYCDAAKQLLRERGVVFAERDIRDEATLAEFRRRLPRVKSIPQVFFDNEHVGGYEDLRLRVDRGDLNER